MSQLKRIHWIDIAKGYGVILVILGHCINKDSFLHNWIFSFHMPLFFVLAGYCFNEKKYDSIFVLIKAKWKSLIVPYFILWGIGLLVSWVIPEWRKEFTFGNMFIDIYRAYPETSNNTSIWFLISLFIVTIAFYIIITVSKYLQVNWLPVALISLSGTAGYIASIVHQLFFDNRIVAAAKNVFFLPGNRLPLTIDASLTALVFFAIGYYFQKRKAIWPNNKFIWFAFFSLLNTSTSLLNGRVNVHGCRFGNPVLFYISALSGVYAVLLMAKYFEESKEKSKGMRIAFEIMNFYGKNSLIIFGIQSLLIHLYIWGININSGVTYVIYDNIPTEHSIISFILVVFLVVPIVMGYYKIKTNIKLYKTGELE